MVLVDVEKFIWLEVFLEVFHMFDDWYMKEDAGVVVMKYSVLLGDLWKKFNSDFGDSSLLILNISSKHV